MGTTNHSPFDSVRDAIGEIFSTFRYELLMMFKDAGAITFFVILPLAYPLVYAYIYNNETATEVPVVVIDNSKSSLSRDFIRRVNATAGVTVAGYCNDLIEAKEAVWEEKAYGIVLIPEDFSRKLLFTHEQSSVMLYSDMSGLLLYKAMLLSLTDVSLEMGKEIEVMNLPVSTARETEVVTHAILASDVNLFNEKAGFGSFLVPVIMILLIQQALLLGVGMLIGTSKEYGGPIVTFDMSNRFYVRSFRVIVGKALCYLLMFSVAAIWLLRVVPVIFNFPMSGVSQEIALFLLPYLLACIFFAITLSAIVRDRESPFLIFVFTSVPLLFLSGISWPESAMPEGWKWFSCLFPSTFGIQGFVRLNTSNALLSDVSFQYIGLWIQTGVYFLTAFFSYGLLLRDTQNAGR